METRISTLFDGELEDHEVPAALDALRRSDDMRRIWGDAQLIGDALREEPDLGFDVTARVMSDLEQQPTVLAPHSAARTGWTRPALALAASLAGVAVVGWLALAPTQESAQIASTPVPVLASTAPAQAQTLRLQEYLVAHQAHGGAGQITGGVRNVRTVAVAMEAR